MSGITMRKRAVDEERKASSLGMWVAIGTAIYLPQLVLVASSWRSVVATAPIWGAGLLGVVEMVAGVALLAAICAGVAIWRARAPRKGRAA